MTITAYTKVILPVNLDESVPPKVNSPLSFGVVVVGSKDMPISLDVMVPWLNRLSVTVGMEAVVSGDKVPTVKSTGPILKNNVRLSFERMAISLTRESRRIHRIHSRRRQRLWTDVE